MEKPGACDYKGYIERLQFYKKFGYDIEKEREFILKKAGPLTGNILEVGTGKGHFSLALARKGYNFTTIDISREDQKLAHSVSKYLGLEGRINFKLGNAEHLEFKDSSFIPDLVDSYAVLKVFMEENNAS